MSSVCTRRRACPSVCAWLCVCVSTCVRVLGLDHFTEWQSQHFVPWDLCDWLVLKRVCPWDPAFWWIPSRRSGLDNVTLTLITVTWPRISVFTECWNTLWTDTTSAYQPSGPSVCSAHCEPSTEFPVSLSSLFFHWALHHFWTLFHWFSSLPGDTGVHIK